MSLSGVLRVLVVRRVSSFRALLALMAFLGIVAGASPRLFAQVTQLPTWAEPSLSGGPSAREDATMAYDVASGQVVLFGGNGSGTGLSDTWTWNGSTWTEQSPVTNPPARSDATMAYDAASGQVVLFGGSGSSGALNDTWTWNGSTWTEQSPVTSPPARSDATMAYDVASSQLVLFGGFSSGDYLSDTWTWNGSTWTQRSPVTSPPARYNASMAYDAASSQVVLFGGFGSSGHLSDTWTWNGSTWTQQSPVSSPSARGAAAMAYDAASSQIVLFGGFGSAMLSDTWIWNGSTWTNQSSASSPPARDAAAIAYDVASGQVVLFGGFNSSFTSLSDTWTLQTGAVNLGTANVCPAGTGAPTPCSQTGSVSFSVAADTTIGSINILTQGSTGLDFQNSSGSTCLAQTYSSAATCTVDVTFAPTYPGPRNGAVVIEDGSGNVLGTAYLYGTGAAPQVAFTPGTINTIAGAGSVVLNAPMDLAMDGAGNLYVTDFLGNIVQEVNASTGAITTVAGTGTAGYSGDGGAATSAELNDPTGIAADGAGNLYIANTPDSVIREVTVGSGSIRTVVGSSTSGAGYTGDGGPATSAKLYYPRGLVTDGAGNLYIADTGNNVIRKVAASTGIISTVAGTGYGAGENEGGYTGDGGLATSAELNQPFGVGVDSVGNLYIADSYNNVIRKVAFGTGIISTVAGNGTAGYKGDGELATGAELNQPVSVAADSAGNLYIGDYGNNVIRKVAASTGIISTVAGTGMPFDAGDGGPATKASMHGPEGVVVDSAGNLYIVDSVDNLVRKVNVSLAALNFVSTTPIGSIDTTDGPQTVSVSNIGNAPLTFTAATYPANFPLNSSDTNLCSSSAQLLEGTSCDASANFDPTGPSTNTGSITLTDNALNLTTSSVGSAQQSISLSGMASSVTATTAISSVALTQNHLVTAFTPVTGSGGTGMLSYSISPALPAGLGFSSTSGAITGTPTATVPSTTYTVTVTDSTNVTGTATFSLMVNSAVTATTAVASATLTQGHAVTAFTTVTGTGGTGALSYSISPALPAGLTLSPTSGTIVGTPTAALAATTYTVTVTDTNGAAATATFRLTVNSALTATTAIASKSLTENYVAAFTPVTGTGGTGTLTYSISPVLPAGLSFASTSGMITGTPTATSAATTYTVTLTDSNGATTTATFRLIVNSALTATTAIASKTLTKNYAAAFTPVTGAGGTGTLTYSISPALPAGLSFSSTSGAITGAPTTTSAATAHTVTLTDTNGATATATFSLTVNSAVTATIAIASKSLTENYVTAFTPVTGTGGTGTLSYSISPALPAGLSLSSTSVAITGTPTATIAATTYTVTTTDTNGATATASFSLTVNSAVAATASISSKMLTEHYAASFTPVTGTGGTGTLSYSISPALLAGLSLSSTSGTITGTPTATSLSTTYTVTVTDSNNATTTASFSLTVNSAVTATASISSKTLTEGYAASFTPVMGTGGTGTLTYSISPALPAGLSLSSTSGTITGTPTATIVATTYTVTATDTNGATATATFSLTVNGAVVATQNTASRALAFGQTSAAFTPVIGTGGTGMLTYSISPATLPAGLSFAPSTGTITGTVTATSAATTYTVTVTDTNGATATASFSLTVNKASSTLSGPATQPVQVVASQAGSIPVTVAGQYSGGAIATPGSTISYTVSGNAFAAGTATISSGAATIPVPSTVAPGTYTVTVSYAGDANYNAATSITIGLQVGQIQPTISWAQPPAITYGASLANALNASAMNGPTAVPGTYSYLNGTAALSAATVLPAGTYTLTVNFTPTNATTYKTATGNVVLTVNKVGVSGVVLNSTVNPVLAENPTTLVATVSSALSTPTGTVSFFYGSSSTPLGTATLSGGIAQLPVSTLPVGTDAITAVYSGDANFLGATSTALSELVEDFTLSISSSGSSATVTPGGTANYGFTLTPTGASTFPAAVTLSATGLPPGATYTVTPSTIAAGASTTSVQLAISVPSQTASQTASLHGNSPLGRGLVPVALGLLLLPFSRRMRRSAGKLGRMAALLLLLVAGAASMAGLTGCGSSTGYFDQPQQTYTVTVTATSGTLTHSTPITLTVQ